MKWRRNYVGKGAQRLHQRNRNNRTGGKRVNVFSATGNLGKDARTNNVNGTAVCNFPVAVKSGYGDKEQTLWLDCALWGKRAEGKLPEYLTKGAQVAVSGELGTREHEGKTYLTLRVSELDLVGGKRGQDLAPSTGGGGMPSGGPEDNIPFAPLKGREWMA